MTKDEFIEIIDEVRGTLFCRDIDPHPDDLAFISKACGEEDFEDLTREELKNFMLGLWEGLIMEDSPRCPWKQEDEMDYSIKHDEGKIRPSLVPTALIRAVAEVREYGVKKYGDPDSWKRVEAERYKDACYRHWLKFIDDPEGVDKESGLPHLWHVACNIAFLCDKMEKSKEDESGLAGAMIRSLRDAEEAFRAASDSRKKRENR